jgi:hypothetical protein
VSITEWLTGALTLITGYYAYLTSRILKANERSVATMVDQAEQASRPYIVVAPFLKPHSIVIYLRVTNTGRTVAEKLRLTLGKDIQRLSRPGDEYKMQKLSAFSEEISTFAPGAELFFMLGTGITFFGPDAKPDMTPAVFDVTASYSWRGRTVTETTTVDIRPLRGADLLPDSIVEELEKIRKALEKGS